MPFVNVDLVRYMLKFKDFDAVVPRFNGYTEPLHAVYSKNVLPMIENQIKKDELRINETIKKIKKIKYIEKEEIEKFDKAKLCFFNINDKNDFEEAKRIINEKRA
ncbi:MAG: putative molybdenum cofactor guanylyltransferase [Candidatus Nomurabacteria bacterium GW2011_GWA2_40_9]|uniref:Putative molybdenum cofactor guanylyltransferase n=1 Tax=Candidatus Nomurabacteria bacterium GW2011_GWA2_40_9 TaxID=1618734 RepID=A0A0G0TPB2_9BACT|nr:MAG: putative molybdenum cofactor guanylyltransferase [Candidatus Nomurabacteria bacterium GW2011_GWA2_40_9]